MTDDIIPYLERFTSSKRWLQSLKSAHTKEVYALRLKQYCDAVEKNPDEILSLKLTLIEIIQLAQKQTISPDIQFQAEDLLNDYLKSGIGDSAALGVKAAVKSFYTFHRRSLDPSVAKDVVAPEPKQRSPKINDLIELDAAMFMPRDRAIVWAIASGAFRDNELISLNWEDKKLTRQLLEDNRDPTRNPTEVQKEIEAICKDVPYYFVIESKRLKGKGEGKYSRHKHVAFLHWYAAAKLDKYEAWVREYFKRKSNIEITGKMPLFISLRKAGKIGRLRSANPIFSEASIRAWQNLEQKRFSPHDVRDFLQSGLESANVHGNIIAPFMAHKVKGVDFHYSAHEIIELLVKFRSALPWLVPQSIEQTNAMMIDERKRIAQLEKELSQIRELYSQTKPLIENIDEIVEFLDKRREEKWAEDEAKRQEQEAEETARLTDEANKNQKIDWKKLRQGKQKPS
jgi:hypothetical protein